MAAGPEQPRTQEEGGAPGRAAPGWPVRGLPAQQPRTALSQVRAGMEVAGLLLRRVAEDPEVGRLWRRVAGLQCAATLLVAGLLLWAGDELTEALSDTTPGLWERASQAAAAVYASLALVQWTVVALSRDFHDAVSRRASLLVGLEPEDPERTPRVRLDVRWMRAKLRRRWRALWVLLPGLMLISMACAPLPGGRSLNTALGALWGAHWWVVFTAAKSARAWEEPAPCAPWYLRGWQTLTTRVFLFRWWGPRGFLRWWEGTSRTLWGPVSLVERRPWALVGLSLVRAVSLVPFLKYYLRPLVPVAAALLIERGPEGARAALATRSSRSP